MGAGWFASAFRFEKYCVTHMFEKKQMNQYHIDIRDMCDPETKFISKYITMLIHCMIHSL